MGHPRWRKVFVDLWGAKARTLLVVLTIAVGAFAVGFVSDMLFLTLPDMDRDFQRANPHSAILYTAVFDEDLLHSLAKVPGVEAVEGRGSLNARALLPNGSKAALALTSLPTKGELQIDKIFAYDPPVLPPMMKGEGYLERSAAAVLGVGPGDTVSFELDDERVRTIKIVALVHSPSTIPYMFMNQITIFTEAATLRGYGGTGLYDQVLMRVSEKQRDADHVQEVASLVGNKIENSGRPLYYTFIYMPGQHFAATITQALGFLMLGLGILAVFLGTFLVINTINALIGQQVRYIGVMKAIGARSGQIVTMYIVLVLGFGVLALLIALPLQIILGSGTGNQVADMLNFIPGPARISTYALGLSLFVALVVPLVTALRPVLKGTRVSVREAISDYGIGQQVRQRDWIDRLVERIRGLPRPLLISLRNTFRRKGRLFLTMTVLVLAGAIFIGVFNLRASMNGAIEEVIGYILSDVNIAFDRPYRMEELNPILEGIPGIVSVEAWGDASGTVMIPGTDSGNQVALIAPPADSTMIDPTLTAGRWLVPDDENAIVIGNHLTAVRPELKVGDQITLDIYGQKSVWTIVGIYRMAGNNPTPLLYVNKEPLLRLLNDPGRTATLRIKTTEHTLAYQRQVSAALEAAFAAHGIRVVDNAVGAELISANNSQTDVLVYFMLMMALLIAVVGGLGLASTMSMNVLERTREIGVMRAIGARNGSIFQLVVVEGMFIGILSWILGAILAIPIGSVLAFVVGTTMLQSALAFSFSMGGFLLWLILVIIISALASLLPARNAVRLTIREVLAYE
jgi:putative ABC transport system permease protein